VAFALPITTATALITAALGWMRAGAGEFDPHLLAWHRFSGIGVLVFCLFAWLMHRTFGGQPASAAFRFGYRGLLLASFVCLGLAGHFGGSLTHGSGFLTLNAPPVLKKLLAGLASEAPAPKAAADTGLYAQTVQPAFAKKCYSCHGAEKQKGKFRLDLRDAMLKGGDSGEPVVVPGDLGKSRLIYHVLLPRDHDDAMPPKGKEPLTPEEIVAIAQWIQAGASFE
jgi:mono/diheme cytochrome c family protein